MHAAGGVPGGARGELALLDEEQILPADLRQVVEHARPHHAATDDHRFSGSPHALLSPEKSARLACGARLSPKGREVVTSHSCTCRAMVAGVSSSIAPSSAASITGTCTMIVAAAWASGNASAARSSRQDRMSISRTAGPESTVAARAAESSTAAPHPGIAPSQALAPSVAGAVSSNQRPGRTDKVSRAGRRVRWPQAGRATPRAAASRSRSALRLRKAASSRISAVTGASRIPAPGDGGRGSGPDTQVLRVEHVGAHDLELRRLIVERRDAEQTAADALAAAREQREPHPALELGGGGG